MIRISSALATVVVAVVALSGCAAAEQSAPESTTTVSAPEPTATAPEPSPTQPQEGVDTSDWLSYATHDGDMTYRYPADWTLESEAQLLSPDADRDDVVDPYERWMDSATLTAPNGQPLLQSGDFVDIGGACDADALEPFEVLAAEPAAVGPIEADDEPTIATVAVALPSGRWRVGVGITAATLPASGEPGCMLSYVFGTSEGGASIGTHFMLSPSGDDPLWTVDTLDDARAYMETGEYATILEILRSVRTS
jgi:hypothetical protein